MDWVGITGLAGTFGFGILSLYQWTALKALRQAIGAHAQTTHNICWNIGNDNHLVTERAMKTADSADLRFIIGGSRSADASSVSARHAIIGFSREHSGFEPFHEVAWESRPQPAKPKSVIQRVFAALSGA
jgi:hypothetical protein